MTAAIVVIVSETAKRSDKLGGFIAALPLVTVRALIWLYVENQGYEKIANHAWYTFWYVIPTLPMFLLFPLLLPRIGFWLTLVACVLITVGCFAAFAFIVRHFGTELLPRVANSPERALRGDRAGVTHNLRRIVYAARRG